MQVCCMQMVKGLRYLSVCEVIVSILPRLYKDLRFESHLVICHQTWHYIPIYLVAIYVKFMSK